MAKVLFLDIDGVLNSGDNLSAMTYLGTNTDEFGHLFDERCVRWLRWIVRQAECKIVVSSTWRAMGLPDLQRMWASRKLLGEIIDVTPTSVDKKIVELYAVPNPQADRGFEIEEWIQMNKPEIYCIVDDASDMLSHQYFVKTDRRVGLDHESARSIVAILNEGRY